MNDGLIAYEINVCGEDVQGRDVVYGLTQSISTLLVERAGWDVLASFFTRMQREILWSGNVDKTKLQWSCRGVYRWDGYE